MYAVTHPGDSHSMRHLDQIQIAAWKAHLRDAGYPHTTIHTYVSALTCAMRELPCGLQATGEELLAWLATRSSPRTRSTYTHALRHFYGWCVKTGRLDVNPAADLPPVRVPAGQPRPIPADDLDLLLTYARSPEREWMMLLLYEGLRCCDLAQLRREDITQETVLIRRSKGGRSRVVPTHPAVWELVRDLPPGPVASTSAARISSRINRECDVLARVLGRPSLAEVTAHRLRHTAGTIWYRATRDLRATQQLLGHASPSTTQVYAAPADETLRAAVLAMPTVAASGAVAATGGAPAPAPRRPARSAA
jgi:integrase